MKENENETTVIFMHTGLASNFGQIYSTVTSKYRDAGFRFAWVDGSDVIKRFGYTKDTLIITRPLYLSNTYEPRTVSYAGGAFHPAIASLIKTERYSLVDHMTNFD